MNSRLALLSLAILTLSACNFPPTTTEPTDDAMMDNSSSSHSAMMDDEDAMMDDDDAMMDDDDSMMKDDDDTTTQGGVYTDFDASVIGNGETSVLFFHAAWCPYCREDDAMLKEWYEENPFPVSVYKIDYDSSLALRQRFGVTSQHTYVVIDGEGNAVTSISDYPSDEAIQSLLENAI